MKSKELELYTDNSVANSGQATATGLAEVLDQAINHDQVTRLVRRIFTNKDGSTGLLNLVCSDLALNGEQVATIYKKRWKVEVFHKSLKSNASLAKSPTRRVTTQNNPVFMSIYAVFKLECLKIKHKTNHFALRAKLYIKTTQQALLELQRLRAA